MVKNQRLLSGLKILTRLARLYIYRPSKILRLILQNQWKGKFSEILWLKLPPKINGFKLALISNQAETKLFGLTIKGKILETFPFKLRLCFKNRAIS